MSDASDNKVMTKVLVIDDEKDLRDGCERILKKMACIVFKAKKGEEGVELFKKERPEIILSDLKMPGIDGIEVLRQICEIDSGSLVIILTGFATIETAIEAMKQGAYDFIAKPFEPDQLRIVVGRALEKLEFSRQTKKLENERLKTLADLGTEKSRMSAIIEFLPNGIVVTNKKGNLVLMNPLLRQLFAIEKERKTGDKIDSYIYDKGLCKLIIEISEGKHINKIPTYELTLPNETYLLASGQSVLDQDGECIGAVIIFANITDLKNFDQLKSDFVAKVSHELRSPLTTIHEQIAAAINDMSADVKDENRIILSRAKEKTRGLIAFIGDLLDLSRIEAGNNYNRPKSLRIDLILDEIVKFLESRAATKKQSLQLIHRGNKIPYLIADPLAIESIFGNLITNAIKYTPQKGKIVVTTDIIDNHSVVEVIDNGFGMDEQHYEMIFEKFYRIKNEKTRHIVGTGLGLSIVKGLVDSLKGDITIKSTPDKGSTFKVVLPL